MVGNKDLCLERNVTFDDIVCERPCLVHLIVFTGQSIGGSVGYLRDGHSIADPILVEMTAAQLSNYVLMPPKPIRFNKGVFFDRVTATGSCFIQYEIL